MAEQHLINARLANSDAAAVCLLVICVTEWHMTQRGVICPKEEKFSQSIRNVIYADEEQE